MQAGRLNRRVELQYMTVVQSNTGEETETWATVDTVWAAIEPMRGREYFEGYQTRSEVTTRITIRHRRNVTPEKWRVKYGSRVYEIISVIDPKEAHVSVELMCKEGLNE